MSPQQHSHFNSSCGSPDPQVIGGGSLTRKHHRVLALILIFACLAFGASAVVVELYYGPTSHGHWWTVFIDGPKVFPWSMHQAYYSKDNLGKIEFNTADSVFNLSAESLQRILDVRDYSNVKTRFKELNEADSSMVYQTIANPLDLEYTFSSDFSTVLFHNRASGRKETMLLYKAFVYLNSGDYNYVVIPERKAGDIRTMAQVVAERKGRISMAVPQPTEEEKEVLVYDASAPGVASPELALAGKRTARDSVAVLHMATAQNSGAIPQEMIYLHLDNTSYYRGDSIFFAGYLVSAADMKPSVYSETVYTELLNPSGKIIDRCVLRAENGRFHGALRVDETPFYSGYYEVRSYTRYMRNFGQDAIYSRVLPIFNEPKAEGDWTERSMTAYGTGRFVYRRPKPQSIDDVNLKFYPEGGRMTRGLPATVGFELTDRLRRPLRGEGKVVDLRTNDTVAAFISDERGRGRFSFTPMDGKYRAAVIIDGERYLCDLPEAAPEGVALSVDNLTGADSVYIDIARSAGFPAMACGVSLTCRGALYGTATIDMAAHAAHRLSFPRTEMPTGVMQVTLFDAAGTPLADRLFFNNRHDIREVRYEFDKDAYGPNEVVEMTFNVPSAMRFSLSVTDAADEVPYGSNIMADLLLASEIKGYVHNPAWYFDGEGREAAMDNLLMVQGWRKYSWEHLAGMKPYQVEMLPEKGIEVLGSVTSRFGNKPRKDVDVTVWLSHPSKSHRRQGDLILDVFKTDSLGRFFFRTDRSDIWTMTLGTSKYGFRQGNNILLNRSSKPIARAYDPAELQLGLETHAFSDTVRQEVDTVPSTPGYKRLKEVEVTANRYTRAWEIGHLKQNSVVSYNIADELDRLQDEGCRTPSYLTDLLPLINDKFLFSRSFLTYRDKRPLFSLDPEVEDNAYALTKSGLDFINPLDIPVEAVKTVYINEEPEMLAEYAIRYAQEYDFQTRIKADQRFGGIVFLELYPEAIAKVQPGMRRTTLDCYSIVEDFYSPDYSDAAPVEDDRRRTLYWNPMVKGDDLVRFYNNSTARKFNVTIASMP